MYTLKLSSRRRYVLGAILIMAVVLTACGVVDAGRTNWSGLTAVGDRVYVAYGGGLAAVDVVEQQQLWIFPDGGAGRGGAQIYAPPYVDGDTLYVGDYGVSRGLFSPGVLVSVYALADTGNGVPTTVWVQEETATDRVIAAPLVVDERLYIATADNFVLALDAADGRELWRFEMGHSAWSQPSYSDGLLFVGSVDRSVYALDATTGELRWQRTLTGGIPGTPLAQDDRVYVGSFDNTLHALSAATGEDIWVVEGNDWVWSAPAVGDAGVYFADASGTAYGVSLDGQIEWQQTLDGSVQASPVLAGDTVYVAWVEGDSAGGIAALSTDSGAVRWTQPTTAPLFTTPVVVGDAIVVALEGGDALLHIYDLADGTLRWTYSPATE